MKSIDIIDDVQHLWDELQTKVKFRMKDVYNMLCSDVPKIPWCRLFQNNIARPRALMTIWLACHGRLDTKYQLFKFGLVDDNNCCFCANEETINHLFYGCHELKTI